MPSSRKKRIGFSTSTTMPWSMSGVMCQAMRGDLELAALDRGEEAVAVAVARMLPPVERRAGHLAGPAEAALVRPVGGLVGDVERLVDEAPMQLEHHRLRMGVADVGMGVMDEEDFADHVGCFQFWRTSDPSS